MIRSPQMKCFFLSVLSHLLSVSFALSVCPLPLVLSLRLPFIFSVSAEISMQPLVDIHNAYACASVSLLEFVFGLVGQCMSRIESWRTSLFAMRIRCGTNLYSLSNNSGFTIRPVNQLFLANWPILLFLGPEPGWLSNVCNNSNSMYAVIAIVIIKQCAF